MNPRLHSHSTKSRDFLIIRSNINHDMNLQGYVHSLVAILLLGQFLNKLIT
ncbi:hypothetical protein Peur_028482 [Populus x canadensis]